MKHWRNDPNPAMRYWMGVVEQMEPDKAMDINGFVHDILRREPKRLTLAEMEENVLAAALGVPLRGHLVRQRHALDRLKAYCEEMGRKLIDMPNGRTTIWTRTKRREVTSTPERS